MHIYKFLLEHFTDEQRFSITSKINLNILGKGLIFEYRICTMMLSCSCIWVQHWDHYVFYNLELRFLVKIFPPIFYSLLCG